MTDDIKIRRARVISRITTWTLRLMVAITILFFLSVIMASTLGGNGETQRKALENVISGFFGYPVQIHQLNMYQLFPTQRMDMERVVVIEGGAAEPIALLQHGLYVNDPIAAWTGKPPIEDISFDHFMTRPGYFGPYSLHLKEGRIKWGEEAEKPEFVMTGTYGSASLYMAVPMVAQANGKDWTYRFDGTAPIKMMINENIGIEFHLQIQKNQIIFDQVQVNAGEIYMIGTIIVPRGENRSEKTALKFTKPESDDIFTGEIEDFGEKVRIHSTSNDKADQDMMQILKSILVQGKANPVTLAH